MGTFSLSPGAWEGVVISIVNCYFQIRSNIRARMKDTEAWARLATSLTLSDF